MELLHTFEGEKITITISKLEYTPSLYVVEVENHEAGTQAQYHERVFIRALMLALFVAQIVGDYPLFESILHAKRVKA